jgi:hypothetical protein
MAYGRLDVFSPDGPIQIFPLSEPTVSIGRSTGNTIVLDNTTISRYHFTITQENKLVFLTDMDSANGTYVDGIKLAGNEKKQLQDGEEILIGNLRMIFHTVDDSPTVKLKPLDETTQRIEMALADFYIDLQGPEQSVAPGAHISAELSITNTAKTDARFRVEVLGPPQEWIRIDRPTPMVDADETTFVLVNFKPTRHSSSVPGDYPVKVRVSPRDQPKDVLEAELTLKVLPFSGFGIDLEGREVRPGQRFKLIMHNQGSAELPLIIAGVDRADAVIFKLATTQVQLEPGQRRSIEIEAQPRKKLWFGNPRRYPFEIVARSQNHAGFTVPLRAYLDVKPALPGWSLALMVGAAGVIGLMVAVMLAIVLRTPPPEPVITSFVVNKTVLARGEVLEVSWAATDVAEVQLSVNGTVIETAADPQQVSFSVNTESLSGAISLLLEGYNGDAVDSHSAEIVIYEPMQVAEFEADPPQLVRFVVQGLNLRWDVPGAARTSVTGLEAFNTPPLAMDGPTAAFTDLPLIPTDPLALMLVAEDAYGNVLQQPLTINVVSPECAPADEPVSLLAGPDPLHQVVGTVPADTQVIVDARDKSGDWLRVSGLTGGIAGWARWSDFTCAAIFNPRDLRIETNVPVPPTVTPTPTLTPVPTFTPTVTSTPAPGITPTTSG